jgi:hypothetical protein
LTSVVIVRLRRTRGVNRLSGPSSTTWTRETRWRGLFDVQAARLLADLEETPQGSLWTQDLYGAKDRFLGPVHGFAGNLIPLLLGRLARQLEAALAALAACKRTAPSDRTIRDRLVAQAGYALWLFIVQREACGLNNSAQVMQDYGVPNEVSARMAMASR